MPTSKLKNIFTYYFPVIAFLLLCVQHYFFLSLDNSPVQGIDFNVLKKYTNNFFHLQSLNFLDGIAPNLISQINNMFFNILFFFTDVDFLTSYHWANIFYALLSIILLCKCCTLLYGDDLTLRNLAIFIFITLPVFSSAIKRHYIHYQEAVLFILCCFTFLRYCKKSTIINGIIHAISIVALCSIYYSGLFYAIIFIFFSFITILADKKNFSYKSFELFLYSIIIIALTNKQIILIISEGQNRFSDNINLITTFNISKILLDAKMKVYRLAHYIFYSGFMPLYVFSLSILLTSTLTTKFYTSINKNRFIFLTLQATTVIALLLTIIAASLGIDQVATPAFVPILFFIVHFVFIIKSQKKLYILNYTLLIAAGIITSFFSLFPQTITEEKTHAIFVTDKKCFPDFTYRPISNNINITYAINSIIEENVALKDQNKIPTYISCPKAFLFFIQAYNNLDPNIPKPQANLIFLLKENPLSSTDKFLSAPYFDIKIFTDPEDTKELFDDNFITETDILKTHFPVAAIYTPFDMDLYVAPKQLWLILINKKIISLQSKTTSNSNVS